MPSAQSSPSGEAKPSLSLATTSALQPGSTVSTIASWSSLPQPARAKARAQRVSRRIRSAPPDMFDDLLAGPREVADVGEDVGGFEGDEEKQRRRQRLVPESPAGQRLQRPASGL